MNRLKSLPWTQILLFLLLAATVANYIELRRVEDSIDAVDSQIRTIWLQMSLR
jgi:hypothetical protein